MSMTAARTQGVSNYSLHRRGETLEVRRGDSVAWEISQTQTTQHVEGGTAYSAYPVDSFEPDAFVAEVGPNKVAYYKEEGGMHPSDYEATTLEFEVSPERQEEVALGLLSSMIGVPFQFLAPQE